ncbi:MAG: hypothetical protein Q9226_005234 [Calogaya cf. arnoldii]
MSGMEALAIIGCIAAVVSAYRDGGVIVDKIKQKRLARNAPPPLRLLEDSLARGPRAVEEAKETGIERFGAKYADKEAVGSLKDILIDLQGSLLKHLRQAQEDDNMTDFTTLVDASDIGRIRTVTVLNELYIRVANGTKVTQTPFGDMGSFSAPQDAPTAPNPVSQIVTSPPASLNNGNTIQQPRVSAHPGASEPPKEQRTTGKASFWDKIRRKSSSSDNSTATSSRRSSYIPLKRDAAHQGDDQDRIPSLTPTTSPQPTIDEENPWATENTQTSTADRETAPNDSFSRAPTLVQSGHQRPPITSNVLDTSSTKKLSPHEPHGGFCKGAYKLQVQEKDAMKLRNLPVAKTGGSHYMVCISEGRYWACCNSLCVFEGPARLDGRKWAFDDTVRERYGVRYRWSFLAKAHVALSKAENGKYDYGCLFCIYDGYASPVYHGIRELMAHVGQHRGKPIAETLLQRIKCIRDRTATFEEDFDVNLTPLEDIPHSMTANPGQSARRSLLIAAASEGVSWTTNDETTNNNVDPWRDAV